MEDRKKCKCMSATTLTGMSLRPADRLGHILRSAAAPLGQQRRQLPCLLGGVVGRGSAVDSDWRLSCARPNPEERDAGGKRMLHERQGAVWRVLPKST